MQETCMCWGLEVPDSWLPVIEMISSALTYTYVIGNKEYSYKPKFIAKQVKSKFNDLRFYFGVNIEVIRGEMPDDDKKKAASEACKYADGVISMASVVISRMEESNG